MTSTLTELCKQIQTLTETLEDEIKRNIIDCHKLLTSNEATETKLALEKARDYHYKEILEFLRAMVTNLRNVIFHEGKIRNLKDEKNITLDELKRYSHVQRQVNRISNPTEVIVTKKEKRRVASEVSLESLEAWELYLERKAEEEEKTVEVEKVAISKRKSKGNRKKKKFISSTFNNFLDYKNASRKLDSILEDVSDKEIIDRLESNATKEDNKISNEEEIAKHQSQQLDVYSRTSEQNSSDGLSSTTGSDTDDENINDGSPEHETDYEIDDAKVSNKFSVWKMAKSLNQEYFFLDDTKPKVIDVVYKKMGH